MRRLHGSDVLSVASVAPCARPSAPLCIAGLLTFRAYVRNSRRVEEKATLMASERHRLTPSSVCPGFFDAGIVLLLASHIKDISSG